MPVQLWFDMLFVAYWTQRLWRGRWLCADDAGLKLVKSCKDNDNEAEQQNTPEDACCAGMRRNLSEKQRSLCASHA